MTVFTRSEALEIQAPLHTAHCMVYALPENQTNDTPALISMQIRDDGHLGFPGGCIEAGESWEKGLERELWEENALKVEISPKNYAFGSVSEKTGFCHHFYIVQISERKFVEMERGIFDSKHFGHELVGITRVPLHVGKNNNGLPQFLKHRFVAGCKSDLLRAIEIIGIRTKEQISHIVKLAHDL